jgi:large subunit ribosomal protein L16
MLLIPRKVKYRKQQRGRDSMQYRHSATRGITVAFGSYGLKAAEQGRIRSNQIEAARRTISRAMGKVGRTWIRIFPDRPYTQKAAEVGMGKGKGDVEAYEAPVLPGRVLFEIDGVTEEVAREALRKAGAKLPIKTRFVARNT